MRILAFPRNAQNPYQDLLYSEMERLGARVGYLGCMTPSRTVNLLLLPLESVFRGANQAKLIHLHWVYGFGLPGAHRFPLVRRLAQSWFTFWLRTLQLFGIPLVWTAHNVLPHAAVFADDIAARRTLVAVSDLVLGHSESALAELAALGAVPARSAIIPHGPLAPVLESDSGRMPGRGNATRQFLFFGKILEYKGVEDLVLAFAALPSDAAGHLIVAGECEDEAMRARLRTLARVDRARITLRLERIAEQDVPPLLTSSDIVVLPYRRVTTSGSAMLALAYGRPLIVPDLPAFAHLPAEAIFSYDGTRHALTATLAQASVVEASTLLRMADAAQAYASSLSWHNIAVRTKAEMNLVLGVKSSSPSDCKEDTFLKGSIS